MADPNGEVPIPKFDTAAIKGTGEPIVDGEPIVIPDLAALFTSMQRDAAVRLNSAMPGVIQGFDSEKQTVTVQVAIAQRTGDTVQKYPILLDVPLMILSGGNARLTFPVVEGDPCLVLFCDRDIDNWFIGQSPNTPPATERIHDLSDGIALVGIRRQGNFFQDYNTTDGELSYGEAKVKVKEESVEIDFQDSKIIVDANSILIQADSGAVLVKVNKTTGKVKIASGATTLKAGLDSLCSALLAWVDTRGDTPNPATQAAITAAQTLIDGVLE